MRSVAAVCSVVAAAAAAATVWWVVVGKLHENTALKKKNEILDIQRSIIN